MSTELAALRTEIDAVDQQLLRLFSERVALVLKVGDIKRERSIAVYDPSRERAVLERLASHATPPVEPDTIKRVFERVIDECRRLEQHHVQRT